MEKFNTILAQLWREACWEIEIDKSCVNIAALLSVHMPIEQVLVQVFDHQNKSIETVAVGCPQSKLSLPHGLRSLSADQWQMIKNQCSEKTVLHSAESPDVQDIKRLLPLAAPNDVLLGTLQKNSSLLGTLAVIAVNGTIFSSRHTAMLNAILEPFSIALENHLRVRELEHLREAAEADTLYLLRRLRRNKISDRIVGEDTGLKLVMQRVKLVAASTVPVLLLGETGTGKEVISREIHRLSSRSEGPFIRVNCGAIPPELIDSQLFGHEKGAFTGATNAHKGWFERADGGTLFLDEIGELPLAGQVRLLRILQDGWLERVGGKHSIHVDVRIVVATHQNLANMVNQGTFREDLWYRIAVFPILLPSLAERPEDIGELAVFFAEKAAARFMLPLQLPTDEDIQLLRAYPWPGNIRELGSVIDRAALLGNGKGLEVTTALGWKVQKADKTELSLPAPAPQHSSIFPSLNQVMKAHIERALVLARGQVEGQAGAAVLLKIHPNTLRARMRKLGIKVKLFRMAI